MSQPEPEQFELPVTWVGLEEEPIYFANQILVQFQPDEFVLALGQATAPPVLGTPEQVREQLEQITYVPIRPIARIGLTRKRIQELIAALQANLDNHDRAVESTDPR